MLDNLVSFYDLLASEWSFLWLLAVNKVAIGLMTWLRSLTKMPLPAGGHIMHMMQIW